MKLSIERPQTPPPPYLLTPPPTGGVSKRVRFIDAEVAITNSKRQIKSKEGESSTAYFEDPQEGSDIELSNVSDDETITSTNDTSTTSPASSASVASKRSILKKHDPFTSLAIAIDTPAVTERANAESSVKSSRLLSNTGPFPFMRLPLSVRNKVYEHLLVIPAIICIRQKHTSFHDEKKAFLYAERREVLPGIAYALAQLTVDGYKVRFSRFGTTNINILCVSKEIHAEAKAVLYGKNAFEIVKPTNEMSPPPDFSVRLFPSGCQRLVTKLNIRIRSFYDLHWLLSGGYNVIKNHYRGLATLILILELESASRGFSREWSRKEQENWKAYIKRLRGELAQDLFGARKVESRAPRSLEVNVGTKVVPTWINLRVLFSGESYAEKLSVANDSASANDNNVIEQGKRDELKQALVEAWELLKRGSQ